MVFGTWLDIGHVALSWQGFLKRKLQSFVKIFVKKIPGLLKTVALLQGRFQDETAGPCLLHCWLVHCCIAAQSNQATDDVEMPKCVKRGKAWGK